MQNDPSKPFYTTANTGPGGYSVSSNFDLSPFANLFKRSRIDRLFRRGSKSENFQLGEELGLGHKTRE